MKTNSLQLIRSVCMTALLGLITSSGNAQSAPGAAGQPLKAHLTILPGNDPGPPRQKLPYAINDQGTVVGYSQQGDLLIGVPADLTAFTGAALWSGKGFDFSILPDPPEATAKRFEVSSANGINNKGVVVGHVTHFITFGMGGSISSRAVRWDNGVPTDLGAVSGYSRSTARAINNAGEIAGSIGDWPTEQAVRWTPSGQLQQLDLLPTHNASLASGINAAGRIVGSSGFVDGDFSTGRPVCWDGTSVTELATPAGFDQGQASAINAAGTIVGYSATFDLDLYDYTAVRATIWTEGAPSLLPLLPGFSASSASSINGRGMAIGRGRSPKCSKTSADSSP